MKKTHLLVFILIGLLGACQNHPQSIQSKMVNISDSSMIDINHYEVKKISVGKNITNKPMASQVISMNGMDKYVMLDEFYLYVFDWQQGIPEDSVSLHQCGLLRNCS